MNTVSVSKQEGLSPFFERSFDDVAEAARFAESWLPMYVTIRNESGKPVDTYGFIHSGKRGEIVEPVKCGAPETPIFADDELLHACATCDRAWYIDNDGNVLAADRCPACDSANISVNDQGARTCGACDHEFFFDGLTFVDPATVEGGAE